MARTKKPRCWCYLKAGCRQTGSNTVRIGARVIHFCDNPNHAPKPVAR